MIATEAGKELLFGLARTTFLHVPVQQCWVDLAIWEKFLCTHGAELKSIIELGTGNGGMSTFLLLQCIQRQLSFYTFDIKRFYNLGTTVAKRLELESHFYEGNIFDESKPKLFELLEDNKLHPILLYCDNGDKPREFTTFVPFLQPGDYVAVHDWEREFTSGDVEPVRHLVEQIFWELCEDLNSVTRFWKRI